MSVLLIFISGSAGLILACVVLILYAQRKKQRRELKALLEQDNYQFTIVDVRSESDFHHAHVPGAVLLPPEHLGKIFPVENMFQPVYVYGKSVWAARRASRILGNTGYFNVYNAGSFRRWKGVVTAGEQDEPDC